MKKVPFNRHMTLDMFSAQRAKLGDFLKNLVQKRVGVRPPPGSAPKFAAFFCVILSMRCLLNSH